MIIERAHEAQRRKPRLLDALVRRTRLDRETQLFLLQSSLTSARRETRTKTLTLFRSKDQILQSTARHLEATSSQLGQRPDQSDQKGEHNEV